jgi:formylglycine-generating enzyme required for sulfatase activity
MHGNVREWTLSASRPYPYREDDGRNDETSAGEKMVRGGSWNVTPDHATASVRAAYPAWQQVFDVGFRIVVEE